MICLGYYCSYKSCGSCRSAFGTHYESQFSYILIKFLRWVVEYHKRASIFLYRKEHWLNWNSLKNCYRLLMNQYCVMDVSIQAPKSFTFAYGVYEQEVGTLGIFLICLYPYAIKWDSLVYVGWNLCQHENSQRYLYVLSLASSTMWLRDIVINGTCASLKITNINLWLHKQTDRSREYH